ncbi:RICIN domain-containing protein [Streptomyces laurentii]|uniref:RICIN domain-containing protein n=1 Tax=Streptomyces laurentii TaxID=39478 RepID=UPI0036B6A10E
MNTPKWLAASAAVAALFAGGMAGAGPAASVSYDQIEANSLESLAAHGTVDNVALTTETPVGTDKNQRWHIKSTLDHGLVKIINQANNLCVDVLGGEGGVGVGEDIVQHVCHESEEEAEEWYQESSGAGTYKFRNRAFDDACMTSNGPRTAVTLEICNGGAAQEWRIRP